MKKRVFRLICLVLTVLLLTGCAQVKYILGISSDETPYSKMVYTRPNLVELRQIMDDALLAARGDNFNNILDSIYTFNTFYDNYYTNYSLADIRYSSDLTDLYWEEEYRFCVDNAPALEAALKELYHALAQSPCRAELEGEDFVPDCVALIRAKYGEVSEDRHDQQKMIAALMRYGYAMGEIRRAMDTVLREDREE